MRGMHELKARAGQEVHTSKRLLSSQGLSPEHCHCNCKKHFMENNGEKGRAGQRTANYYKTQKQSPESTWQDPCCDCK
jgi:hypothetical protein